MAIRRKKRRSRRPVGAPPGTLVHIGERKLDKVRIRVIDYDARELREHEFDDIEECLPFRDRRAISWINIDGLHQVELIRKLGQHFNFHPLVLESIVDTGQRPTVEEYDECLFIVAKMLSYQEGALDIEQLSIVLGPGYVITFQERVGDFFNPVRERLRAGRGRIRGSRPDYLAYALLDAVVDHYFIVLEELGDRVEDLGYRIMRESDPDQEAVYALKTEAMHLRRAIWPMREVVDRLYKEGFEFVQDGTKVFLQDLRDHCMSVLDQAEATRETTSSLLDLYLSSLSQRMNEVMKVLTVIATTFIPLTFLAGIYGMNFEYMPELRVWWAYPALLGGMLLVFLGMLVYFRRKRWI